MRARRDELSGVLIRESGKTWREADADVCEAIDFCEYYARQAFALETPRRLGEFIGELDLSYHEGRGVCVVISPWNFPLAICMGMAVAALVTGNTVVVNTTKDAYVAEALLSACNRLKEDLRSAQQELAKKGIHNKVTSTRLSRR